MSQAAVLLLLVALGCAVAWFDESARMRRLSAQDPTADLRRRALVRRVWAWAAYVAGGVGLVALVLAVRT
jgi:hypothetical protein